ncbi:MAG: DNA polymerase III subunit gamma/tau [Burkholderiales bacterium]
MSYLVLARKYRPKNFTDLVGQPHVVTALTNALTSQRLHHAYLFTGTRGVGKTTISRILAKSLNCLGPDGQGGITANPCGVCQACTDIDGGRFVDYTELDAASNRGVGEVQALLEQAVYKPVLGRFKVFMIDEVHMLTNHAFNAMLKTLEEPPEYLKFVLATTDPQKVPVTVLSRCLQFNLRPMAPDTITEQLRKVLGCESVTAESAALHLLARAARGSMRDALSLTDQAMAFCGGSNLQEAPVRQMLGSADRAHVFGFIEALAQGDGKAVVDTCEALRLQGQSAAATLEDMSAVLQRMAVWQMLALRPNSMPAESDTDIDPDAARIAHLATVMPADETQLLYSLCLHGRGELGLAPDEYAALTMVLLRLLAFKSTAVETAQVEKKSLKTPHTEVALPAALPVQVSTEISPSSAPPPAAQLVAMKLHSPPEDVQAPDLPPDAHHAVARLTPAVGGDDSDGEFWHATVQALVGSEAINALVRELALQSQLVARDTDHWMLRVERESLNQSSSRERLQTALATAGYAVSLSVEVGRVTDSPARRIRVALDERLQQAEKIILSDAFYQALVRDFDAKIVPGTLHPL